MHEKNMGMDTHAEADPAEQELNQRIAAVKEERANNEEKTAHEKEVMGKFHLTLMNIARKPEVRNTYGEKPPRLSDRQHVFEQALESLSAEDAVALEQVILEVEKEIGLKREEVYTLAESTLDSLVFSKN